MDMHIGLRIYLDSNACLWVSYMYMPDLALTYVLSFDPLPLLLIALLLLMPPTAAPSFRYSLPIGYRDGLDRLCLQY